MKIVQNVVKERRQFEAVMKLNEKDRDIYREEK